MISEQEQEENVSKTELYQEKDPQKWPIVYHSVYNISFFGMEKIHPFDAGKWGKIFSFLKEDGMIKEKNTYRPSEASKNDLLVVHTKSYLNSLKWSGRVALIMEVPPVACLPNPIVQNRALKPFRYHTGGTILAAKLALDYGWAINLGGGFHHCSFDQGGGFCAYADITLALRFLFLKKLINKALIVDLDAHQGNGHERDFFDDKRVYIMDMYNSSIYPHDTRARRGIRRDIQLRSHTSTKTYMPILQQHLPLAFQESTPDIILYNAGTDCLSGDPLGALDIDAQGIIERDQIVFEIAKSNNCPIVMVTSGGYQRNNARIIADSILNLKAKGLISIPTQLNDAEAGPSSSKSKSKSKS